MTTKNTSITIFLVVNLLFFTLCSACNECEKPKHKRKRRPPPPPQECPPPPPPPPSPEEDYTPPEEEYPPPPPALGTCPTNVKRFGVCADFLGGIIGVIIGSPGGGQCCSLFEGLTDVEAAHCACGALKANVLGIQLNLLGSLTLILNGCSRTVPQGCRCA